MASQTNVSSLQIKRDRKLVKRLLKGDEQAFNQFVADYFPRLYRYALCQLNNPSDVDDIVQTALTIAARRIETYRGEATLLTWLIQICRHEIYRKHATKEQSVTQSFLSDDLLKAVIESLEAPEELNPENATLRRELISLIQMALDQLPEGYARILEMKYVEGFSSREIAAHFRFSDEAAQSMLARARRAFREICNQAVPSLLPAGHHDNFPPDKVEDN